MFLQVNCTLIDCKLIREIVNQMTIPVPVKTILSILEESGYTAHCVGGCVRDALLGREPNDWDVTTSAKPERVMELFAGQAIPTGVQHGTVTVQAGGMSVEVTTHRKDGLYLDNRRPSCVDFSASLEEDLARRDFTVNAMAMDLRGTLTDLFGGREDLSAGVIRCVGDPEQRFREDGLRIIRALRFSAQLGFSVDRETSAAIRACRELLRNIAAERLEVELTKLLCGKRMLDVLLGYPEVLGVIMPEILPAVGFDQRNRHHCYDVWEHTARATAAVEADSVLRWTMLLHDLGKPDSFVLDEKGSGHFYGHSEKSVFFAAGILERLKMDHKRRDQILTLIRWHDSALYPSEKCVRRALRKFGEQGLFQLIAVQRADNLAQHPAYLQKQLHLDSVEQLTATVLQQKQCFSLAQLAVKGNDLTELGIKGKSVGLLLHKLLGYVVDGVCDNEKSALLKALEEELK